MTNWSWVFAVAVVESAHVLSHAVCSTLFSIKKEQISTRWLMVHALVNLSIAVQVVPSMIAVRECVGSTDALTCLAQPSGAPQPMQEAALLHVYHVLFYDLSREDIFHHALFAVFLILPGLVYEWGHLANFQLFFIHGLPGFVIYAYIVTRRAFRWRASIEPVISALVNIFIRMPGVLYANALLYSVASLIAVPHWATALNILLGPFNAIYYACQSAQRCILRM